VYDIIFFNYMSFIVVISKPFFGFTGHITILIGYYLSKARFAFEELMCYP
jgi:hypothetical protein